MFIPPSTSRRRPVAEYSRIVLEPAPISVRWLIPELREDQEVHPEPEKRNYEMLPLQGLPKFAPQFCVLLFGRCHAQHDPTV